MTQVDNYQIIPQSMMGAYLDACQKFRDDEFGADVTIPLAQTKIYRQHGTDFYCAYGAFTEEATEIKAIAQFFLISEAEYGLMREGRRDERELKPWTPADGPAILWVASVLSQVTGGASKVINAMIELLEASPHLPHIKTVAAFVTGAKGYIFAEACGMKPRPEMYHGDMPFFECPFSPALLADAAQILSKAWTFSAAREGLQKYNQSGGAAVVTVRDGRYSF